jgi:hypothetical protein
MTAVGGWVERASSSLRTADARNGIDDFILIMPPAAALAEQRTVGCIGLHDRRGSTAENLGSRKLPLPIAKTVSFPVRSSRN